MNITPDSLAIWLAGYYLQSSGVLIFTLAGLALVRRPDRRLALSWSAAFGLLVLLALSLLPAWPRHSLSLTANEPTTSMASTLLVLGFATGATLTSLFLLLGLARTAGMVRRSRLASQSCRRLLDQLLGRAARPDLRESDELGQAVALGTVRPAIVLPAGVEGQGTPRQLRYLLAHEAAHIRQGDLWLLCALRLLMPVLFLHPLYWWWRGQLRDDQEYQADAIAAGSGDAIEYVEALVHWARQFGTARVPAAALGYGVSASQLSRRVRRLLASETAPPTDRAWTRTARLSMASLIAGLSLCSLTLSEPSADPLEWAESSKPTGSAAFVESPDLVAELGPMPAGPAADRSLPVSEHRQVVVIQVTVDQLNQFDWRPSAMIGAVRQRINAFGYRWLYLLLLEYLKQGLAEEPGVDGPGFTAMLDQAAERVGGVSKGHTPTPPSPMMGEELSLDRYAHCQCGTFDWPNWQEPRTSNNNSSPLMGEGRVGVVS